MPLTSKIIRDVVKEEVGVQLKHTNQKIDNLAKSTDQRFDTVNQKIDALAKSTNQKIDDLANSTNQKFDILGEKVDHLTEVVVDFAGQVKKFDEEQTVLSGQVSRVTDRVEKLELAVN